MAETTFGVNHPLARDVWSKDLSYEALRKTYFSRFMGEGEDNLIQIRDDLTKSAGDNITCGLVQQLSAEGIQGDTTAEGREEAMQFLDDKVVINQIRKPVKVKGKMTEQRVPYSLRETAKGLLRDWWQVHWDTAAANQLAGNTAVSDTSLTGNNATIAPTSNRIIIAGGQANDQSLTSTDTFTLELVDIARVKAENFSIANNTGPVIRPFKVEGEDVYVMFLHDYQVHDLRREAGDLAWSGIQRAAMQGGDVAKNPIFSGALGMYNGVILHKWSRLPNGVNSSTGASVASTKRAVLCGAQALTLAFGKNEGSDRISWKEEMFDYENQFGCLGGSIYGMKKTKFIPADDSATNAEDFATLVVSTYAAEPATS